jgi:hypothetical protein
MKIIAASPEVACRILDSLGITSVTARELTLALVTISSQGFTNRAVAVPD